MKKIAALVPNKLGKTPGQRFRIEAWSKHLPEYGWTVDFYPFESDELDKVIYTEGNYLKKASGLVSSYRQQLRNVLSKPECDVLLIYREASVVGPSILERLAKRLKVPIVYDIDDPLFLPYWSSVNKWFSLLKFSRKTHSFFRMADHIISINKLMGDYARKYNPSVSVVPNFVDINEFRPAEAKKEGPPTIVWMGSFGTVGNLVTIARPLHDLQAKYDVPIRIVANSEPTIEGVKLDFRKWSPETEVSNLQECDIGLVPLLDVRWNPWKFFLKTVQYMGAGLPVVARRMGSNAEIIQDGVNGFLVETEKEWFDRLSLLLEDADLRRNMGREARKTVVEGYSLQSQMPKIAEIFDRVCNGSI